MKRLRPLTILAGGALVAGLALSQGPKRTPVQGPEDPAPAPGDPERRPDEVQRPVELALAAKVQALEAEVTRLTEWVAAQQAQAAVTLHALDQAEAAGFTAGINPNSRELLLAAWRAEARKVQGVAAAQETPAERPNDRRR